MRGEKGKMQYTYTYDSDGIGQGTDPESSVKIKNVVIGYYKQIGTVVVEFDARDLGWADGSDWVIQIRQGGAVKSSTTATVKTTWDRFSATWEAGKDALDSTCKNLQDLGDISITARIADEDSATTDVTETIGLDLDPNEFFLTVTTDAESTDATPDIVWTLKDLFSEQKMSPVVTVGDSTASSMTVAFEEAVSPTVFGSGFINLNGVKYSESSLVMNSVDAGKAYWVRADTYTITAPTMSSGSNSYTIDLNCTTI